MFTFVVSLSGVLFGYVLGIVGVAMLYIEDTWPDTTTLNKELFVALPHAGAFFGSLATESFSNYFGRKPTLALQSVLFVIGAAVMAFAESIPTLMVGSFFVGLCVGLASQLCPVYLSEISPNCIRGASISIFVLFMNLGPILSLLVSIACDRDWRLMLGLTAVPAIL